MELVEFVVWTVGMLLTGAAFGAALHAQYVWKKKPRNYQAGFTAGYWEGADKSVRLTREAVLRALEIDDRMHFPLSRSSGDEWPESQRITEGDDD